MSCTPAHASGCAAILARVHPQSGGMGSGRSERRDMTLGNRAAWCYVYLNGRSEKWDMASGRFVAYYRVSTDKQGRSGLGLEAQRATVAAHLNGGPWRLVAEFVEVESGKRNDRPEIARALAACRVHNATLIIANISRLARNVHFISGLMESGVDFVAADMPTVNRLTVHILAAVAEEEARLVSSRTKLALAAAKARGVQLGKPENLSHGFEVGRERSAATRSAKAERRAADLADHVTDLRASGATSLRQIAAGLNAREVPAPRGGMWSAPQVARLLERVD